MDWKKRIEPSCEEVHSGAKYFDRCRLGTCIQFMKLVMIHSQTTDEGILCSSCERRTRFADYTDRGQEDMNELKEQEMLRGDRLGTALGPTARSKLVLSTCGEKAILNRAFPR